MTPKQSILGCHNFDKLEPFSKSFYDVVENWLKIWIFRWYWT